ncbi:hypothetical protein PMI30_04901 [Pseudomonas sp. GM50]|uniref:hypothetical protein n=1 Tax=Pseudomonas sp. GM50 TaxID=1144332 RepID=UPI000270CF7B|nr:hypothetical protein [Pseudomonas sp. GM50]EJM62171.1 hypothetical protein PMI30_04901 [Pseudomonas sp. GM50]
MNDQKMIPRSVWYGLEGTGYDKIAQELKSEDPLLRKWIAIYAIYKFEFSLDDPFQYYDFISSSKNSRYAVIEFSIPIETIKTSDGIDGRDITIIKLETTNSEEEVNLLLEKSNIAPELFTPPWRCDYPL